MKIFISYGWPEGPWHGEKLAEVARSAGHTIVSSAEQAEIVIAHSGGCFMIDSIKRAKMIVLIGLPCWPGRSLLKSTFQKVKQDTKNRNFFFKTSAHSWYCLTRIKRWRAMYRNFKAFKLPSHNDVYLVHNEFDTYLNQTIAQRLAKQRGWNYVEQTGGHDDLWESPDKYLQFIMYP
jgi:hypothetical protein